MFGRRKDQTGTAQQGAVTGPQSPVVEKVGGKNRPTPKRRQAEARNRRPLVPDDRKAAAKASREKMRAERLKARQALMTGDERHLPERDKGPVKRFVRDVVDARFNAGEVFLFVALAVVLLSFIPDARVNLAVVFLLWFSVIGSVADGFVLARQLRRRLTDKFGEVPRGAVSYGVMRAFQIRRTRLPKPQVARGQYPS